MYRRILHLDENIKEKSIFLFGPRQTGKSTLVRAGLPDARVYNLLDVGLYRTLGADPTRIKKEILSIPHPKPVVVIDEIQMLPELLNEVHLLIEEHGIRFVLTGSSARSLKRKGVNLLGGRARSMNLHPLVSAELGESFDLMRALNHGLLPAIYDSHNPDGDLNDYAGVYLREEIAAEGVTRNIPAFSRFLEVAAISNGQILNHTNIASDAEVKRTTVIDYYQVLLDTLLGFELPAWKGTKKRKPITTSKFYLFDPGVARHLAGREKYTQKNAGFGAAFEHFIFHELRSACDYGYRSTLHYWRSTSGFEVDFILDGSLAIEVKAASTIRADDLKGLKAIREEHPGFKLIVVAMNDREYLEDGISIIPWKIFLQKLWNRTLFTDDVILG